MKQGTVTTADTRVVKIENLHNSRICCSHFWFKRQTNFCVTGVSTPLISLHCSRALKEWQYEYNFVEISYSQWHSLNCKWKWTCYCFVPSSSILGSRPESWWHHQQNTLSASFGALWFRVNINLKICRILRAGKIYEGYLGGYCVWRGISNASLIQSIPIPLSVEVGSSVTVSMDDPCVSVWISLSNFCILLSEPRDGVLLDDN